MKKLVTLFLVSFVFLTSNVDAKEVEHFKAVADDDVSISDNYNSSVVAAGSDIDITGNVSGIGTFAAENIEQTGTVDYGFYASNMTTISGVIEKDAFSASASFKSLDTAKFNRDVFIASGDVVLNGEFQRNVNIYASNVILNNVNIKGNITINASEVKINDGAVVAGTLSYNKDADFKSSSNGINEIKKTAASLNDDEKTFTDVVYSKIWSILCLMLVFGLICLLFPKVFSNINTRYENMKGMDTVTLMGKGALALLLVPIIAFLLLLTIIGIPICVILILIYCLTLYLSTIFGAYLIGYKVWNKTYKEKKDTNTMLYGAIGLVIILVLELIPVVGSIVSILVLFGGLGVIFDMINDSRK